MSVLGTDPLLWLQLVVWTDDGVFWLSREEFFRYFTSIYVCAASMTAFLED